MRCDEIALMVMSNSSHCSKGAHRGVGAKALNGLAKTVKRIPSGSVGAKPLLGSGQVRFS